MSEALDLSILDPDSARALSRFIEFLEAQWEARDRAEASQRRANLRAAPITRVASTKETEADARRLLATTDAAVRAGNIHDPERFLLRVSAVERVDDRRRLNGEYDPALNSVSRRLDDIAAAHGFEPGEGFRYGEGPPEYKRLLKEYDEISDRLFARTLREFGLHSEAQLFETDRDAFDAKREVGRRAIVEGLPDEERTEMLQCQFEEEARAAGLVGAYHAGAVMLGAAMEAALLRQCLRQTQVALAARNRLPEKDRPRGGNPKRWRLVGLSLIAQEAGWLPDFHASGVLIRGFGLVDLVRDLRNLVHPAKHLHSSSTKKIARATYEAALSAYDLIKKQLTLDAVEQEEGPPNNEIQGSP